jgi:tetratricopeptide (TPR) repeat protein
VRSGLLIAAAAFGSMLASTALAQQPPPTSPPPVAAPTAPAAPPSSAPAPTEAQRETAREAYARGQALFAQDKFADAKAAFEQAYAAVPNPVVLLSIAESDVRLGNLEAALDAFQRYLAGSPDAPDRAQVEQKIADLLATPATLLLSSEPAGAEVTVDGQNTGKITPAEIQVTRGDHAVELSLAGHQKAAVPVTARIGARHELHVALQPVPPANAAPEPLAPAPAQDDEGSPTTALWITGVVGAAGLITGTVLGFMVLAERSDFDAEPTADSADRGERLALFTDVAFGVGAMALLTGAVIYLTAGEGGEETPSEQDAARLQLTPLASPDGAGVMARTRF